MEEITLPSGGTVTIRDPKEFRAGEKYAVSRRMAAAGAENNRELRVIAEDQIARLLVTAWSIPYLPGARLPSEDPDAWSALQVSDYDQIIEAARPAVDILFPGPVTPDDADKPGSPTAPDGG